MELKNLTGILIISAFLPFFSEAAPSSSATDPSSDSASNPTSGTLDCRRLLEQDPQIIQTLTGHSTSSRSSNTALLYVMCRYQSDSPDAQAKVSAKLSTKIPNCSSHASADRDSSALCVEKIVNSAEVDVGKDFKNTGLYVLVKYSNRYKTTQFRDSDVEVNVQNVSTSNPPAQSTLPPANQAVNLGGGVKEVKCRVFVSGATEDTKNASCSGTGCQPLGQVTLNNGKLIFDAILDDVPADMILPKSIKWSGGPDNRGVWETAPTNQTLTVQAEVESINGDISHCALRFRQLGQGYTLTLNRYGECPDFRAMRDYYFLNSSNTGVQIGGYGKPLSIPGFEAQYGSSGPDLPFRGVFNAALNNNGQPLVQDGRILMPDINNRPFKSAVVVARSLDPKLKQVGAPLFWGVLDPLDYKLTSIHSLNSSEEVSDKTLISFQFFLAQKQIINGQDIRGLPNGLPLYEFREGISGVPFDRLVPVVNESCMPIFQVRAPARADKKLPPQLQDNTLCAFSKPFTVGDLKAGRVNLTVMHLTAENAYHEFPLDLIKGDEGGFASETVYKTAGNANRTCWIVDPRVLGSADWADGGYGGYAGSRATTTVSSSSTTGRERIPGNECSTRIMTRTTQTTTYSDGGNDLNGRLGYRYNWTAFFWGASLGCAVTQNWSGVPVYGSVESTAASSGVVTAPPLGTKQPHFDKISCTKGSRSYSEAASATLSGAFSGFGSYDDSGPPPPIHLASYVFNKATYPTSQVRIQRFHVRPWGHATGDLAEGAAGSFDVPLCPGSQFAYDNISLSWSPLILDIGGKGISISRTFKRSVGFDIRGQGYLSYVDWPENTSEVAFLVVPNSKGQIDSIRELFGDADGFENGFEKLKTYDSNKDGVIDSKDAGFKKLALWFDFNRDGKAQKNEIQSLAQHGVERINLKYSRPVSGPAAQLRTLSGLYLNSKSKKLMNIEDHYFNEYEDSKRKEFETQSAKRKGR